jgi:hypothetical protein
LKRHDDARADAAETLHSDRCQVGPDGDLVGAVRCGERVDHGLGSHVVAEYLGKVFVAAERREDDEPGLFAKRGVLVGAFEDVIPEVFVGHPRRP